MHDSEDNYQHRHSATESVGVDRASFSGQKIVRFTLPEDNTAAAGDDYVTLDVGEDSAAAHSVEEADDPELTLEKKSSFGSSSGIQYELVEGLASVTRRVLSFDQMNSAAAQALNGFEFISKSVGGATWTRVEKRFDELTSTTNGMLPRSLFGECIGMSKESDKNFAGELFDALSRRRSIYSDSITKEQLKEFWDQIADPSFDGRLQTFFDMIDKDADGRVTEDEVREIISMAASANKLSNIQKRVDEYARLIMEELDPDNIGYIMIESLELLLLQVPKVEGTEERVNKFLGEKIKPEQDHLLKKWYRDFHYFLVDNNNWQRVWVLAVWIGVMGALFAYKYVQYKNRAVYEVTGHCVCVSEGAAETLKLNMALILLPVCQSTITWLRNKTKLGSAVPFDDNINFHKVISMAIAVGVVIHGTSHLACDFPRLVSASEEKYEPMKQFFGEQPTSYWFFVKGWEGVTGIVMVVLMGIAYTLALPWFRRNTLAGFNAFWYSHSLFVLVYILLIIHGIKLSSTHEWYKKTTWMYLTIPILIYAGERLIRSFRSSIKPVKILKVAVYPENLLVLHMSKPQGFRFRSGQYIFVKCAAVSPFEWLPFSITSAPGDDYLIVHFQTLGHWTRKLKVVFCEEQPPTGKSGLLRADFLEGENNPISSTLLIDGPYGAPTEDYKNYDVVLLIGIGIRATPLISITKNIIHNIKSMEDEEDALFDFRTKRAYLHWVNKKQSFDWFTSVMNEVAGMDRKGAIEMHNYYTTVYEEGDARSALIAMLQNLNHAKKGVDIVSGNRVKSHFGRPNWRTVYKGIALSHPNSRVGVFYCGAPPPQKLRQLASDVSSHTTTIFEFHNEYF